VVGVRFVKPTKTGEAPKKKGIHTGVEQGESVFGWSLAKTADGQNSGARGTTKNRIIEYSDGKPKWFKRRTAYVRLLGKRTRLLKVGGKIWPGEQNGNEVRRRRTEDRSQ